MGSLKSRLDLLFCNDSECALADRGTEMGVGGSLLEIFLGGVTGVGSSMAGGEVVVGLVESDDIVGISCCEAWACDAWQISCCSSWCWSRDEIAGCIVRYWPEGYERWCARGAILFARVDKTNGVSTSPGCSSHSGLGRYSGKGQKSKSCAWTMAAGLYWLLDDCALLERKIRLIQLLVLSRDAIPIVIVQSLLRMALGVALARNRWLASRQWSNAATCALRD